MIRLYFLGVHTWRLTCLMVARVSSLLNIKNRPVGWPDCLFARSVEERSIPN